MIDDNVSYEPVESSNLLSVGYDPENANLFVIFKDKDGRPTSKYAFYHVTPNTYSELMAAPSKGKYFAAFVRGHFSYDKLQL